MTVRLTEHSPLVLGSGSPRRREILTSLRIPFVVVVGAADETVAPGESHGAYLERVVRAKLAAVTAAIPLPLAASAAAILVADTAVVVDGEILGKPEDAADAQRMLSRLAGRTHDVLTRFVVAKMRGGMHEETVVTRVTFRALSAAEIDAYAASGEGLDKAGGYAVQGYASAFVPRLEGSYTNVVGLPACEVVQALSALGFLPS